MAKRRYDLLSNLPIGRFRLAHLHRLGQCVHLQPAVRHFRHLVPGKAGWVFDRLLCREAVPITANPASVVR